MTTLPDQSDHLVHVPFGGISTAVPQSSAFRSPLTFHLYVEQEFVETDTEKAAAAGAVLKGKGVKSKASTTKRKGAGSNANEVGRRSLLWLIITPPCKRCIIPPRFQTERGFQYWTCVSFESKYPEMSSFAWWFSHG